MYFVLLKIPLSHAESSTLDIQNTQSEGRPKDKERAPFELSSAYVKERSESSRDSYFVGHGLIVSGTSAFINGRSTALSAKMSYRGVWYTEQLTPSADEIRDRLTVSNDIMTGVDRLNAGLDRPATIQFSRGHIHWIGIGLEYKKSWDGDKVTFSSLSAEGGVRALIPVMSDREGVRIGIINKPLERYQIWGCGGAQVGPVWLRVIYRGDSCIGQREATFRSLLGLKLGRAELGVGWGMAEMNGTRIDQSQGGPLGWLSLPLSAPLYLEMSAWRSRVSEMSTLISEGALSPEMDHQYFMVGFKWTGEQNSLEQPAQKNNSRTTPRPVLQDAPRGFPGSTPSTPSQTL